MLSSKMAVLDGQRFLLVHLPALMRQLKGVTAIVANIMAKA
jgi:hypothetical protein